jgi:tRNA U34 5-carboxymethylaminomethyl modifying GTPase MnmE/TrmE
MLIRCLQMARLARIRSTKSKAVVAFVNGHEKARQLMEFLGKQQQQQEPRAQHTLAVSSEDHHNLEKSQPAVEGRRPHSVTREDIFKLQHHHLMDCLQKTTVSYIRFYVQRCATIYYY